MEEKLRFPENVVYREEPEGGILFDVDTGNMRIVQKVAWGICSMIDEGSTRSEILNKLKSLYPDVETLEDDLDSLMEDLSESGMLLRE